MLSPASSYVMDLRVRRILVGGESGKRKASAGEGSRIAIAAFRATCGSVSGRANAYRAHTKVNALPPQCPPLDPFSGFFSPADPDTPRWQEAQIVQSQLDCRTVFQCHP